MNTSPLNQNLECPFIHRPLFDAVKLDPCGCWCSEEAAKEVRMNTLSCPNDQVEIDDYLSSLDHDVSNVRLHTAKQLYENKLPAPQMPQHLTQNIIDSLLNKGKVYASKAKHGKAMVIFAKLLWHCPSSDEAKKHLGSAIHGIDPSFIPVSGSLPSPSVMNQIILDHEYEALKKEYEELTNDGILLESQVDSLHKQMEAANSAYDDLQKKYEVLEKDEIEIENKDKKLEQEHEANKNQLEKEIDQRQKDEKVTHCTINTLETDLDAENQNYEKLQKESISLESELTKVKSQCGELTTDCAKLEQELANLTK